MENEELKQTQDSGGSPLNDGLCGAMEDVANARLRWIENVRTAFINCRDIEMRDGYEIPVEDWENLKEAILAPIRLMPQ